jgi:hypothetical protein
MMDKVRNVQTGDMLDSYFFYFCPIICADSGSLTVGCYV